MTGFRIWRGVPTYAFTSALWFAKLVERRAGLDVELVDAEDEAF